MTFLNDKSSVTFSRNNTTEQTCFRFNTAPFIWRNLRFSHLGFFCFTNCNVFSHGPRYRVVPAQNHDFKKRKPSCSRDSDTAERGTCHVAAVSGLSRQETTELLNTNTKLSHRMSGLIKPVENPFRYKIDSLSFSPS